MAGGNNSKNMNHHSSSKKKNTNMFLMRRVVVSAFIALPACSAIRTAARVVDRFASMSCMPLFSSAQSAHASTRARDNSEHGTELSQYTNVLDNNVENGTFFQEAQIRTEVNEIAKAYRDESNVKFEREVYELVGQALMQQGEWEKAKVAYELVLKEIRHARHMTRVRARCQMKIGMCLQKMQAYKQAISSYDEAMSTFNSVPKHTIELFQETAGPKEVFQEQDEEVRFGICDCMLNKPHCYKELNEIEKSVDLGIKAGAYAFKQNRIDDAANAYIQAAQCPDDAILEQYKESIYAGSYKVRDAMFKRADKRQKEAAAAAAKQKENTNENETTN